MRLVLRAGPRHYPLFPPPSLIPPARTIPDDRPQPIMRIQATLSWCFDYGYGQSCSANAVNALCTKNYFTAYKPYTYDGLNARGVYGPGWYECSRTPTGTDVTANGVRCAYPGMTMVMGGSDVYSCHSVEDVSWQWAECNDVSVRDSSVSVRACKGHTCTYTCGSQRWRAGGCVWSDYSCQSPCDCGADRFATSACDGTERAQPACFSCWDSRHTEAGASLAFRERSYSAERQLDSWSAFDYTGRVGYWSRHTSAPARVATCGATYGFSREPEAPWFPQCDPPPSVGALTPYPVDGVDAYTWRCAPGFHPVPVAPTPPPVERRGGVPSAFVGPAGFHQLTDTDRCADGALLVGANATLVGLGAADYLYFKVCHYKQVIMAPAPAATAVGPAAARNTGSFVDTNAFVLGVWREWVYTPATAAGAPTLAFDAMQYYDGDRSCGPTGPGSGTAGFSVTVRPVCRGTEAGYVQAVEVLGPCVFALTVVEAEACAPTWQYVPPAPTPAPTPGVSASGSGTTGPPRASAALAFGPAAFMALGDACYAVSGVLRGGPSAGQRADYTVCLYGRAGVTVQGSGGVMTQLGYFDGWTMAGSKYALHRFTGGAACGAGGWSTLTVTYSCSASTEDAAGLATAAVSTLVSEDGCNHALTVLSALSCGAMAGRRLDGGTDGGADGGGDEESAAAWASAPGFHAAYAPLHYPALTRARQEAVGDEVGAAQRRGRQALIVAAQDEAAGADGDTTATTGPTSVALQAAYAARGGDARALTLQDPARLVAAAGPGAVPLSARLAVESADTANVVSYARVLALDAARACAPSSAARGHSTDPSDTAPLRLRPRGAAADAPTLEPEDARADTQVDAPSRTLEVLQGAAAVAERARLLQVVLLSRVKPSPTSTATATHLSPTSSPTASVTPSESATPSVLPSQEIPTVSASRSSGPSPSMMSSGPSPSTTSSGSSSPSMSPTASRTASVTPSASPPVAAAVAGPVAMRQWAGVCWRITLTSGWTYTVCPFSHVSREVQSGSGYAARPLELLGTYAGWRLEPPVDTAQVYASQQFSRGDSCPGGGERSATLAFVCAVGKDFDVGVTTAGADCAFAVSVSSASFCGVDWRVGHEDAPQVLAGPAAFTGPTLLSVLKGRVYTFTGQLAGDSAAWTYRVSLFDAVTRAPASGGPQSLLGYWSAWETAGAPNALYRVAAYTNGWQCTAAGEAYSASVRVVCPVGIAGARDGDVLSIAWAPASACKLTVVVAAAAACGVSMRVGDEAVLAAQPYAVRPTGFVGPGAFAGYDGTCVSGTFAVTLSSSTTGIGDTAAIVAPAGVAPAAAATWAARAPMTYLLCPFREVRVFPDRQLTGPWYSAGVYSGWTLRAPVPSQPVYAAQNYTSGVWCDAGGRFHAAFVTYVCAYTGVESLVSVAQADVCVLRIVAATPRACATDMRVGHEAVSPTSLAVRTCPVASNQQGVNWLGAAPLTCLCDGVPGAHVCTADAVALNTAPSAGAPPDGALPPWLYGSSTAGAGAWGWSYEVPADVAWPCSGEDSRDGILVALKPLLVFRGYEYKWYIDKDRSDVKSGLVTVKTDPNDPGNSWRHELRMRFKILGWQEPPLSSPARWVEMQVWGLAAPPPASMSQAEKETFYAADASATPLNLWANATRAIMEANPGAPAFLLINTYAGTCNRCVTRAPVELAMRAVRVARWPLAFG